MTDIKKQKTKSKKPSTLTNSKEKARVDEYGLTDIERSFCDEVLVDDNGTRAAIEVGYSKKTAGSQASRLLKKVKIASYIKMRRAEMSEKTKITSERVIEELAHLAFFDIRKMFDEAGKPLSIQMLDNATARAISGIKVVTKGNAEIGFAEITEYKISDKNAALEKLAKHLGLYAADNKQKNLLGDLPRDVLKLIHERLTKLNAAK